MAKHRKTRQEKMIADQRHIHYHLEPTTAQVSTPAVKIPTIKQDSINIMQNSTQVYILKDLRKTILITTAIVLAQIFLYIYTNSL